MARQSPPAALVRLVEQDEFTSDVVIRTADGIVLVYDCT